MGAKLFVGNLSYTTSDESMAAKFSEAGTVVSAKVIMDRENPTRSRGFGFVEMSSDAEAAEAVKMLDGKELDGRQIRVSEAKEKQ